MLFSEMTTKFEEWSTATALCQSINVQKDRQMDPSDEVLHPKTMTSILESSKEQKHIGWGELKSCQNNSEYWYHTESSQYSPTCLQSSIKSHRQLASWPAPACPRAPSSSSWPVLRVSWWAMSSTVFYNMATKSVAAFATRQLLTWSARHTSICSMGTTAALPSLSFTTSPLQEPLTRLWKAPMVYPTLHLPSSWKLRTTSAISSTLPQGHKPNTPSSRKVCPQGQAYRHYLLLSSHHRPKPRHSARLHVQRERLEPSHVSKRRRVGMA